MLRFKTIQLLAAFSGIFPPLLAPALPSLTQALPTSELVAQSRACAGRFIFYEGNSATQDMIGELSCFEGFYVLGNYGIPNDEARSVVLRDISAGTRLRLFNSPGCGDDDDWGEIVAKQDISERMIYTFQLVYEDDEIYVAWNNRGGLDGKVSCVEIVRP